ncbi:hypothetical protein B0A48_04137 [Cryoendolithus antarcticus]|uniref:Acid phosphatase-like protein n=1 Tax=Cryoendolithus antarcticus TaxID=1507870 RepID=A0A1V8THK1_9PEZI|nr:hypothetical protein B0A48_04137 [Cryoendolithus antarcticus]
MGWITAVVVIVLLLILAYGGWVGYTHYRARRLGLPAPPWNPFAKARSDPTAYRAPAPAPKGIQGWLSDKFNALRNLTGTGGGRSRTAGGAYESTSYGGGAGGASAGVGGRSRHGFGPLDPDEAWDSRVGNEASGYYEETELGEQPYGGAGYAPQPHVGGLMDERGRQRELDDRYEAEVHGGAPRSDPFGDEQEAASLRAASPRPMVDTQRGGASHNHRKGQSSLGTQASVEDSPTERKSMFREDV